MEDDATRATNNDATACKISAARMGYWSDPYVQHFMMAAERKSPEINRGYFARVKSINILLHQFLELTNKQGQIVNLGCGFDTRYFVLQDEGMNPTNFIDVDFPEVTEMKCVKIQRKKELMEKLESEGSEAKVSRYDLHSKDYHIIGVDMRKLDDFEKKLSDCGFDPNMPTLFLAECVLVYMEPQNSTALIQWISKHMPTVFFINYEQVNMKDKFGKVMLENLKSRNTALPGVEFCASIQSQQDRFLQNGWESSKALDMNIIYKQLPQMDVHSLPGIDSVPQLFEVLDKLQAHYCVCTSYIDKKHLGLFPKISIIDPPSIVKSNGEANSGGINQPESNGLARLLKAESQEQKSEIGIAASMIKDEGARQLRAAGHDRLQQSPQNAEQLNGGQRGVAAMQQLLDPLVGQEAMPYHHQQMAAEQSAAIPRDLASLLMDPGVDEFSGQRAMPAMPAQMVEQAAMQRGGGGMPPPQQHQPQHQPPHMMVQPTSTTGELPIPNYFLHSQGAFLTTNLMEQPAGDHGGIPQLQLDDEPDSSHGLLF